MLKKLCKVVVEGSRLDTLNLDFILVGTHHQGSPVIIIDMMLSGRFGPVSPSSTISDFITELSGHLLTFCKTEMYLRLVDHWLMTGFIYVRSFLVQTEFYRSLYNSATSLGDLTSSTLC